MMQKYTEQHHWNAIFSVGFLAFAIALFYFLDAQYGFADLVYQVSPFEITVMGLAVFRLVRLLSYDKIFSFVRLWFHDVRFTEEGAPVYEKAASGPRRTIADLLECIWCTGIWSALIVVAFYYILPITHFLVIILAVAALGSFLLNVSSMIGRIGNKPEVHA